MWRLTGLVAGLLTVASWSTSRADEPPPLTPPVLNPLPADPVPEPTKPAETSKPAPAPAPTPAPAPSRPEPAPILIIPGVTTPRTPRRSAGAPAPAASPAGPSAAPVTLPPLGSPDDALDLNLPPGFLPSTTPTQAPAAPGSRRAGTSGASSPNEIRLERPQGAEPGSRSTARPLPDDRPRASTPPPPARRSPGLFGRMLPPTTIDRSAAARDPRSRVTVEPRSDPVADAALKRRVERQIRDSLGNRVASYEVRVVDREVVIRARPARFWQRRGVRNTLETLPGLNGYKTTVLVDE